MNSERFSFPEITLLLLGLLLFSISTYFYATDFPIGKYLFGWDFSSELTPVGKLGKGAEGTRRKIDNQSAFRDIAPDTVLYNNDTIVTGATQGSRIEFNDGTVLELDPKTMIKLAYEDRLGLNGIQRATRVNIVSGKVKSAESTKRSQSSRTIILQTKQKEIKLDSRTKAIELAAVQKPVVAPITKPDIKPEISKTLQQEDLKEETKPLTAIRPTAVALVSPSNEDLLEYNASLKGRQQPVYLKFKSSQSKTPMRVTLSRITPNGKKLKVFSKKIAAKKGDNSVRAIMSRPGDYEWTLDAVSEEAPLKDKPVARFSLDDSFEGIRLKPPLIAGKKIKTSRLKEDKILKDFNLQLRWRHYPKVKEYDVRFYKTKSKDKVIWKTSTSKNSIVLNNNKVFDGRTYYQVSAVLPTGFKAISKLSVFQFDFLPPVPVVPENNAVINLSEQPDGVLFTWQKTHFTGTYEFVLGKDPEFEDDIELRRNVGENYLVRESLEPGTYYWRVRSINKDLMSPPSETHKLVVK